MYRSAFPLMTISQVELQMSPKTVSPGQSSPLPISSPLCEDGHPYVTDPVTGRKVCTCNLGTELTFDPRALIPDIRKFSGTVGGATMTMDSSAFYAPLIRGGVPVPRDRISTYLNTGLPGQGVTFNPSMASHPYGLMYTGVDVNGSPIRKAATRETTGPLKVWLSEHKKNPYPTKAEKIMLAIITRMTLTQVSTWFANARRRLKKENKLYSLDRDKADHENEDQDDFEDQDENRSQQTGSDQAGEVSDTEDINVDLSDCPDSDDDDASSSTSSARPRLEPTGSPARPPQDFHRQAELSQSGEPFTEAGDQLNLGCSARTLQSSAKLEFQKPKIWSISEIINEASPRNISPHPAYLSRVYSFPSVPQLNPSTRCDGYQTSFGPSFPLMNIAFHSSHLASHPALISANTAMSSVLSSPPSLHDPELQYAASRLRQPTVASLVLPGRPTETPPPCPQHDSTQADPTTPDTGEPPMLASHKCQDKTSKTAQNEAGPKTQITPEESSQNTCEFRNRTLLSRHYSEDLPIEELSAVACQAGALHKHSQKTTVIKHPPSSSHHQAPSELPHRLPLPKPTSAHQHNLSFQPRRSETYSRPENHVPHKTHPSSRHHDSQEFLECHNAAADQLTRRAQDGLTTS